MQLRFFVAFLMVVAGVFLCSCHPEDHAEPKLQVSIDPRASDARRFSELFEEARYVLLRGGAPLGPPGRIRYRGDTILLSAGQPASCLHLYEANGTFLRSICNSGDGPGAYSTIRDFAWESDRSAPLTILDRNRMTNYTYSSDGTFHGGYRHSLFANALHPLGDRFLAMYCGNELTENTRKLIIWDRQEHAIAREFLEVDPRQRKYLNFFDRNNFLEFQDSLFFVQAFDNTVYHLTEKKIQPRLVLDFDDLTLPPAFLDRPYQDVMEFMETLRRSDYAFRMIGYYESAAFIAFCFEHAGRFKLALYDKDSRRHWVTHRLTDDLVYNGLSLEPIVEYGPLAVTPDGFFVFWMEELTTTGAFPEPERRPAGAELEIGSIDGVLLLAKPKRIR